uniref:Interferon a3-like n=1 Tax=Gasterosteus aculeatus aculeatus TaxID=481459 RepID=A0AAQ4RUZ5_GASAC|nr:interferon a3-like [Gasterosteus aculeatus aculeatus]
MLCRMFSVFVCLSLYSSASSLSCRWVDHKFSHLSRTSMDLLDTLAHNSTNSTEDSENNFPNNLYSQASKASAEDKLRFSVQILEEMAALFEEDHSNASWEEQTVDHFLIVVTKQADSLHSCIKSHGHKRKNKKLQMYFKRLSHRVLEQMGHSAESWELIRKEMKAHLMKTDQLVLSLLSN